MDTYYRDYIVSYISPLRVNEGVILGPQLTNNNPTNDQLQNCNTKVSIELLTMI